MIRQGDTLIQILKVQGISNKLIYSRYLDLFLELNPEVPNSNTLRVGQEVILPVTTNDETVPAPAPVPAPPAQQSAKPAQTVVTQVIETGQAPAVQSSPVQPAAPTGNLLLRWCCSLRKSP